MAPLLSILLLAACGGGGGTDADSATESETATQAGSDVAREAIEAWTENAEGVSGYTVTLETAGSERTETYVKEVVEGIPMFRPEGSTGGQDAMIQLPQLLAAARHEGSGDVGGVSTDVLIIDDAAALARLMPTDGGPFRPTSMEIQVGQDDRMMRQVKMIGEATIPGGEAREVTTTVQLDDWREVDGFAYPFRTTSRTEGLADIVPGSTEQLDAAAQEFERQLAQMPEAQREAARRAMGNRLESVRNMAAGGPIEMLIVVKDLQVDRE
jgi:hypothetical protein